MALRSFQHAGHARHIIAPMFSRAKLIFSQIDFDALGKIFGIDQQSAIVSRRDANPDIKVDSGWPNQATVVIRVFADQVDTPRRTVNPSPGGILLAKFVLHSVTDHVTSPL